MAVYKKSFLLGEAVWEMISNWKYFEKDTVGKQMVRSADSVSANIVEGFGRQGKLDKIKFYYYARASAMETGEWVKKSTRRKLIDEEKSKIALAEIEEIFKLINHQIKFTRNLKN